MKPFLFGGVAEQIVGPERRLRVLHLHDGAKVE